jgi:hypothetical protein
VLCGGYTASGENCSKRAQNRYARCQLHGGRIHPLDSIVKDTEDGPPQQLSRYRQFLAGQITVDDLDDEELALCGFKQSDGKMYKPKNVPRQMVEEFQKVIFDRAQAGLRSLTVDAVKTVGEIMKNKTNEPDIRLKAALAMLDRNLGKTPNVVALTSDKPFEEVFADVFTGTREESRQRRAIESQRVDHDYAEEVPLEGSHSNPVDTQSNPPIDGLDFNSGIYGSSDRDIDLSSEVSDVGSVEDSGRFARSEAIFAQSVEIKPFEYDLSDRSAEIQKAAKKRYASRALGVDLTVPNVPLVRIEVEVNGRKLIRHVDPDTLKTKAPSKSATKKRKAYTLNDFD